MNRPLFPDIFVNGAPITTTDIAAEAQNQSAPKGKPGLAWRKAARALVIRALLLQEAQRAGIDPEPAELGKGRFETADEARIRALLDQEVSAPPPSEAAVQTKWRQDPERYKSADLWEASHILCAAAPGDQKAEAAASDRARALCDTVRADPKSFASLAASESDCSSKSSGGALGQLGPGDTVPEFEAALRLLRPGQIADQPVRTRFGFHVIRMDAHEPGRVLPYDIVRDGLSEAMEKAAWARAAQEFTQRLIDAADIRGIELGSQ